MQIRQIETLSPEALAVKNPEFIYPINPIELDENSNAVIAGMLNHAHVGKCFIPGNYYAITTDDNREFVIEFTHTLAIKESRKGKLSAKTFNLTAAPLEQSATASILSALNKLYVDDEQGLQDKPDSQNKIYKAQIHEIEDGYDYAMPELAATRNYLKAQPITHLQARKPLCGLFADKRGLSLFPQRKIPGQNLLQLIESGMKLTDDDRFQITIAIFTAIKEQVLHYGLIHRDIKPENLRVYQENNSWKVEVIDYDLSTAINNKEDNHLGTLQFKAPEMLLTSDYDESIDIYSSALTVAFLWQDKEISEMILTHYNNPNKIREIREKHLNDGIQFDIANVAIGELLNDCAAKAAILRPNADECIARSTKAYQRYQQKQALRLQ